MISSLVIDSHRGFSWSFWVSKSELDLAHFCFHPLVGVVLLLSNSYCFQVTGKHVHVRGLAVPCATLHQSVHTHVHILTL